MARKSVRADMAAIDAATAARLLKEYKNLVAQIAADFPTVEAEELRAVGAIGIMEGFVTHNPRQVPERAWITQIVRWRIQERATAEISRPDLVRLDMIAEPTTNGRHDPERQMMIERVIALLVYLSPQQAMIVDGRLRRETFEELAASLGMTPQSCHEQYLRALGKLREWLV